MDDDTFYRELDDLLKIEQDDTQRPVDVTCPEQKFKVTSPDLSQSTALYEAITGFTPDGFGRAVKNTYDVRSALDEIDRLDEVTDLSDGNNLRKSAEPRSRIPTGYEAQCLLCNLNFRTVRELHVHDTENLDIHKLLL
jgi:hypothetical protein